MPPKIVWFLVGAVSALLVVLVSTGLLFGFTILSLRTAEKRAEASPRPTPVVIPTPSAGPVVVPTPRPNPYAARFRELSIPRPGGNPYAMIVGSDGAIWFTEAECTSGIGRLSNTGAWQHWPIGDGCGAQPLDITRGTDGNLWFTDIGDRYGRITRTGEITRFQMEEQCYPSGITTGPDGNLWITAASPYSKPFIAKVSTKGTELATYPLSAKAGEPRGIVTGPDGALWFTESQGIGRLTVSGTLTEFPLPAGNGSGMPYQIAVGPDANIWFIEYIPEGDGRIGRMTTSGALTEFATPGMGGLQWITAGPDNALWFTAAHSNHIGRITTSGAVSAYPVPSLRAQPVGIMTGPDGNIWFAEMPGDGSGKIGIFTVRS